jgi:hypothetical protein
MFHGQVGGATCAGCHGLDAKGTSVGADLTNGKWQWGDGSRQAITHTIVAGVPVPKSHTGGMPPLGCRSSTTIVPLRRPRRQGWRPASPAMPLSTSWPFSCAKVRRRPTRLAAVRAGAASGGRVQV